MTQLIQFFKLLAIIFYILNGFCIIYSDLKYREIPLISIFSDLLFISYFIKSPIVFILSSLGVLILKKKNEPVDIVYLLLSCYLAITLVHNFRVLLIGSMALIWGLIVIYIERFESIEDKLPLMVVFTVFIQTLINTTY